MDTEKNEENRRYRWTRTATTLLVSIWSHKQVQSQLRVLTRNQAIWDSIARFMNKKGFEVTGLQCRTRIKNMFATYHEAEKKGEWSAIQPYYETFRKIDLCNKSNEAPKQKSQKKKNQSESEDEMIQDSESLKGDADDDSNNEGYPVEYLEQACVNNDSTESSSVNSNLNQLEKIITTALEAQTKAITQAIENQSNILERLVTDEREKLELIISSERENRRQLEIRLDRLIARTEGSSQVPILTYMGNAVTVRQKDDS